MPLPPNIRLGQKRLPRAKSLFYLCSEMNEGNEEKSHDIDTISYKSFKSNAKRPESSARKNHRNVTAYLG